MKLLILALSTLAAAGGSSSIQERQLDHPWGRWQAGAWVRTESTSSTHEGIVIVEREQLGGRGADGFELTSTLEAQSGDVTTTLETSWAMGGHAYAAGSGQRIGTESVTVEGRARECEVWEARWENEGQPVVERTWVSEEFDFPLRSVTRGAGIQLDVTVVRVSDFVMVGRRKLPCMRLEGTGQAGASSVAVKLWMSAHVPGGVARRETRLNTGSGPALLTKRAVEFHGDLARAR